MIMINQWYENKMYNGNMMWNKVFSSDFNTIYEIRELKRHGGSLYELIRHYKHIKTLVGTFDDLTEAKIYAEKHYNITEQCDDHIY